MHKLLTKVEKVLDVINVWAKDIAIEDVSGRKANIFTRRPELRSARSASFCFATVQCHRMLWRVIKARDVCKCCMVLEGSQWARSKRKDPRSRNEQVCAGASVSFRNIETVVQ